MIQIFSLKNFYKIISLEIDNNTAETYHELMINLWLKIIYFF